MGRDSDSIELRTRVGTDGALTPSIPVGMSEANREFKVIDESTDDRPGKKSVMTRDEWAAFAAATARA